MPQFPPSVDHQLAGWVLFWADLEPVPGAVAALAALRRELTSRARARYVLEKMPEQPTAAAVRKLFRAATVLAAAPVARMHGTSIAGV